LRDDDTGATGAYRCRVTMKDAPWRPHRRPPFLGHSYLLPLAVGAVQVIGTYFAAHEQPESRAFDAVAVLLLVAAPAALVFRRRYPVAVLGIALATTLVYFLLDYPRGPIFFGLIVALVNAVMTGRRIAAVISLVVGYISFLWLGYLVGVEGPPDLEGALALGAWLLVLVTVAEVVRGRRERAIQFQHARAEEARRRASEERLRISQELHDVLAHNISLINVQAGVALHLMDERPEQARTALTAIKQASNDAIRELRSVLDVLRMGNEELPRSPASGLAHVDDLVSRTEAAGLRVNKHVEGAPRPLPPGVDLAAFRIVQEALTNVTRHAGGARATVRIVYGEHDLTVQVDDDGLGTGSTAAAGGGRGIPGMRERAVALGGTLEAGPRAGGGFRVRARLPLQTDGSKEPG
jgi:signal transduction histidine kinase